MNREKLKRIVQDIEATEAAIKDLSAHKRDVYAGNKDEFDPKVLRKIIARRKMDPESRTKDDDLLDQYETALGMTGKLAADAAAGEMTYDDAAEAAGVSRRTMARQIARARVVPKPTGNGTTPHDHETGEITEAATPSDDAGHRGAPSSPAEQSVNPDPPPERVSLRCLNGQGEQSGTNSETAGVVPQPGDGAQDGGHTLAAQPAAVAVDLAIPPFLRRERAL